MSCETSNCLRNWAPRVCQQRDWRILLWGTWPAHWERPKILTSGLPQRNRLAIILSEAYKPPAPHPWPTRRHPEPRFLVCSLRPHPSHTTPTLRNQNPRQAPGAEEQKAQPASGMKQYRNRNSREKRRKTNQNKPQNQ